LLVSERTELGAANRNGSDRDTLTQQWRGEEGANSPWYSDSAGIRKFVFGYGDVMDMNRLSVDDGTAAY